MPDLCFYAPWIIERTHSGPISDDVGKSRKKRVSYDEGSCSMQKISEKRGKVSRLHGPTLHALLY